MSTKEMFLSKAQQHRGIYLLPNLLTSASLFAAYYSIVASMTKHYETAVIAIFIGMIADLLDGRVARLTNTQSEFGAQFDSLSDMVTFGVAPSLLVYSWSLSQLGKIGWLICFTYTAAVALRLARFNAQHDEADIRYFSGIPCPASAGVVCGLIWFLISWGISGSSHSVAIILGLVVFSCAALMVSNLCFYSFKDIDTKGKVPFAYIIIICLVFVAVAAYPALILFVAFSIYALSGIIYTLKHRKNLNDDEDQK